MSNNKSFTLNVECPPEAVREFFEGWAKVEAAKNGSSWPSFDWSRLSYLAPAILPLISSYLLDKKKEQEPADSVPKECCDEEHGCPFLQGCQGQECPLKQCGGLDGIKGVVISFEPKDQEEFGYSSDEPSDSERVGNLVKQYHKNHPECDVKCPKECKKECDDPTKGSEEVLEECCEQECHGSEIKKSTECVKECLEKEVKKSVEEKKPKRPAYTEGAPLVMDFKNLGNAFGQNSEGLNEMMKALGPMMNNLMGGIQGIGAVVPKPFDNQNEKKVDSDEKGEPAKNWSEVIIDEE